MCEMKNVRFICWTMSYAKLYLQWSVIHCQANFEWHSGCGLKHRQSITKTNNSKQNKLELGESDMWPGKFIEFISPGRKVIRKKRINHKTLISFCQPLVNIMYHTDHS